MPTEADSALLGGAGTEGYLYHREPPGNIDLQTRPVWVFDQHNCNRLPPEFIYATAFDIWQIKLIVRYI